jgi:hypothetical protein
MPDPLTVLGGVAGVVQLADVVGRLSKELYGFFWAISDASDELKKLRSALEDLEATIALLTRHGYHISAADEAREPSAVDSGTDSGIDLTMNSAITTVLTSLQRELDEVKSNLPKSRRKGLGIRLKWVLDKQRTMEIVFSIERHKSTLQLAMSGIGLYVHSSL